MNNLTEQADSAFFRFLDNHSLLASVLAVSTVTAAALYWPIDYKPQMTASKTVPATPPIQVAKVSPR